MTRWAYLIERIENPRPEDQLNVLGEQGWELVNLHWCQGGWDAVLKRPSCVSDRP